MADFREEICSGDVYGGVIRCGCGPVGEGAVDDAVVDCTGEGEVREGGLSREGVRCEPIEEGGRAEEAGIWVLGGVDVRIYKPREEKPVLRRLKNSHTHPLWEVQKQLFRALYISFNECDFPRVVNTDRTLGDDV